MHDGSSQWPCADVAAVEEERGDVIQVGIDALFFRLFSRDFVLICLRHDLLFPEFGVFDEHGNPLKNQAIFDEGGKPLNPADVFDRVTGRPNTKIFDEFGRYV